VTISAKARRLQLLQSITTNLIHHMGRQEASGEVESETLARLSQEYGETLVIVGNEDDNVHFAVSDRDKGSLLRSLSHKESEHLQARLTEITMEIIDRNMRGLEEMP
jgi:hypothetical protein